ncbi:MAG: S9 family peptidase [Gammaproteobacteria bacterium]|nr:S9 family peptidase [Gammaproteobacteria bacterium]MYF49337.1 S9 family peptidase [Gammaproteobacteria bacterium]MYG13040.1 S9 family peptidase [Gammaproteobacteria bacterium]MYK27258.1 S9 family peptidase [Gammaproteobacteria bacterium]
MRLSNAIILTGLLLSLATASAARGQPDAPSDELVETAAFFAKPSFVRNIAISPDGKTLMVAAESDDDQTITFLDAASMEAGAVVEFGTRWRFGNISWIDNDAVIVSPYVQPMRRNYSVPSGQLVLVYTNGKRPKVLFGEMAGLNVTSGLAGRAKDKSNAVLLDPLREEKDWVLIQTYDDNSTGFAQLHVKSGRLRNKTGAPSRFCYLATNQLGEVRFCSAPDPMTDLSHVFELGKAGWSEIHVSENPARTAVLSASTDDGHPLVLASGGVADTFSLYSLPSYLDGGEPLFSDPVFDLWDIEGDRALGLYAIANANPLPSFIYPDNQNAGARTLAGIHKSVAAAFPGHFVEIRSHDAALEKVVVEVRSDTLPGRFLLFDRKKNELRHLADRSAWLADRPLAAKTPFTFATRDGLTLHGFLTRALTDAPREAPSIVLVHGGPHGIFDTFHYDPEIQFLAALGLNVIQVNFRGSGGFGQAFFESGYREWSRGMVDDVIAGFQSLAGKEVGEDACIYGASYGAFNALSAAFRAPDAFLCAAGHVGVYSLPEMFRGGDIPETEDGLAFLRRVLGEDKQVHKADSPAFNAQHIRIPVFLSAHDDDERAPIRQTKIMVAALKEAGNPPMELYFDREAHNVASEENETERLTALGEFFAAHLARGSRPSTP